MSEKQRYSVTLTVDNVRTYHLYRLKTPDVGTLSALLDECLNRFVASLGIAPESDVQIRIDDAPTPIMVNSPEVVKGLMERAAGQVDPRKSKMMSDFVKQGGKKNA